MGSGHNGTPSNPSSGTPCRSRTPFGSWSTYLLRPGPRRRRTGPSGLGAGRPRLCHWRRRRQLLLLTILRLLWSLVCLQQGQAAAVASRRGLRGSLVASLLGPKLAAGSLLLGSPALPASVARWARRTSTRYNWGSYHQHGGRQHETRVAGAS